MTENPWPASGEQELRRYRRSATLLLVAMAAVFVAASQVEEPGFWTLLVRAGCEAALVGGLADWFAVTALFRRPLGLPIPHTAVVIRNKDRIGQGLGAFVERHILDPVLIIGRLREAQIARRTGLWLSRRRNAARAADQIATLLPVVLGGIDDRQVRDFVRRMLSDHVVRKIDLASLLGTVLHLLRESGRHQDLFDHALVAARDYLMGNEHEIYQAVENRSNWWIPKQVDRRVAQAILRGIAELLDAMGHREHDVRRKFDSAVDGLIDDLRQSPELAARISALREQILGSPEMHAYLGSVWSEVRALAERDLGNPSSDFRRGLADMLRSLGSALARDRTTQDWIDQRIENVLQTVVSPFRMEIGRFIANVVRGWEAETIAARIEGAVGRDLQYIRINGTVVGGIVGCTLFLISRYLL